MTNFGNFSPILIKFSGEVEFSVTNTLTVFENMVCLGLRLAHRDLSLYPPRNHVFVIFHDGITFERCELEGWNFMWGFIMEPIEHTVHPTPFPLSQQLSSVRLA